MKNTRFLNAFLLILLFEGCNHSINNGAHQTPFKEPGVENYFEFTKIDTSRILLHSRVYLEDNGQVQLLQDASIIITTTKGDTIINDFSDRNGIELYLPKESYDVSISREGCKSLLIHYSPDSLGKILIVDYYLVKGIGVKEIFAHY